MKLAELNPRFHAEAGRAGQGLTFDCPGICCAHLPSFIGWRPGMGPWKKRAGVNFTNPLDGKAPLPGETWHRSGCLVHDITVEPSIWISQPEHWHGYLRNGELVPV